MIGVIARQQLLSLRRQQTFLAFLAVFLLMTALAGVIGWSSHRTIVQVYAAAVTILAADGQPAPPDPFTSVPELSLLANMTIYIPLIGALLALVLGHLAVADEQSTGIGRLVFSRPLSRTSYILGKLLGVAVALGAAMAAATIASLAALIVANGRVPSVSDVGRLVLFSVLSLGYLLLFALVGMLTTLLSRRRSVGLLAAVSAWLVVTFVLPQFTSGLRPTASLNPIADPVSSSLAFFQITARARPLSVSEIYKDVSAQILALGPGRPASTTLAAVVPVAVIVLALAVLVAAAARRHDYSRAGAA